MVARRQARSAATELCNRAGRFDRRETAGRPGAADVDGGARKSAPTFGKSDAIDALAVARAVLREPDLPVARLAGPKRDIAVMPDHSANLIIERTRSQSRLR